MIKLIIEILLFCLFYTFLFIHNVKKDKLYVLNELPESIVKKVKEQRKYKKSNDKKDSYIKELVFILLIAFVIIFINGVRGFLNGYIECIVIYVVVNIYKYMVIYCLIYANNKKYWIEGTEEMEKEYNNYMFYCKRLFNKLLYSLPYSFFVGIISALITFIN